MAEEQFDEMPPAYRPKTNQQTEGGPITTPGCGDDNDSQWTENNTIGVVVSIENGDEILFPDYNGHSPIGELLSNYRLRNVDLYYGKYIIEGTKSPIGKISKFEDGVYIINAKYKKGIMDENKTEDDLLFNPNTKNSIISLLSHHKKYICGDGGGKMVCNRVKLGPWEKFECVPIKGNIVGLKSHTGKWVCAEPKGNVVHNRDKCSIWEQFELIKDNKSGKYGIRSVHFNKYMMGKPNGELLCDRDWCRAWELFELKIHQ